MVRLDLVSPRPDVVRFMNDSSSGPQGWRFVLRALRHRNYRLFFVGQGVSLIGTWMQWIAMPWLIYDRTHSAFLLGLVGFLGGIPALIAAPFAGVIADRVDRRRLLVFTQTLAMIQAFVLSALVLTGHIQPWHIVALSVVGGLIGAFDMPARQAFTVEMVEREDLGNAIALNSSMFQGARLIGPTIAGLLMATAGAGICFLVNGVTYIAVILALLAMRLPRHERTPHPARVRHDLAEGFRYAYGFPPIRAILTLGWMTSLLASGFI